jgi:hypothetical protein
VFQKFLSGAKLIAAGACRILFGVQGQNIDVGYFFPMNGTKTAAKLFLLQRNKKASCVSLAYIS